MEQNSNSHNKKKKIMRDYNKTAYFYDNRYSRLQQKKYEIVTKNYKTGSKQILDLGCGTGLFFEYLIKGLAHKKEMRFNYVGVDISWKMLLEFKSKFISINYSNCSVNVILSDIDYLPFRDSLFISVFALTSFQNLPNINNAIKELFRVCKNNCELKLSILKKNLDLDSLKSIFRNKIKNLTIINEENLEDIVIDGKILKSSRNFKY
ncbi:MAG: class I SAM-dependent methyltransferase [Candidatus Thorarchaeota archaeon]